MVVKRTPMYEPDWTIEVRRAAAQVAVKASKITGRPVDPRVKALADEADRLEGRVSAPVQAESVRQRMRRYVRDLLGVSP
jgi:hypothetical protein